MAILGGKNIDTHFNRTANLPGVTAEGRAHTKSVEEILMKSTRLPQKV